MLTRIFLAKPAMKNKLDKCQKRLCLSLNNHPNAYALLSLSAIAGLGLYVRFSMLSSVGLLDGDDFFYVKWAYLWLSGDFKLFGLYRIANAILGAIALRLFGVNDYSIHYFVALFGTINIVIGYCLSVLVTRSRVVSLALVLIHCLSLRVVEVDRTLIPYTFTETFFLISCVFFILHLRVNVSVNLRNRYFALVYISLSGLFLSFSAHAHWEIACHAVPMAILILMHGYFSKVGSTRFSSLSSMIFCVSFWVPILIGVYIFSGNVVFHGIFNVNSTLHAMATISSFSISRYINEYLSLYKAVVSANTGSYILGIMFFLNSMHLLYLICKTSLFKFSSHISRIQMLCCVYFMVLIWFYILSMRVLNFDSFIRNWHAQHLTVIVLVFTFTLLSSLLNAVFPNPKSTARYVFLLLLIAVFVQSQPLEAFTARFHHPTSYRIMGDVLSSRVSAKDRVLVAPYLVLDFRYQTLTPPSYLSKEYVDHIFEYTSDLPLRIQIQKHGIRYFVDAKQLIHNNADDQVGVKSNLGRVYDIDPNEYSLEIEYARMKEYLREVNAVMIFSSDKIDIYDLKSGT